MKSWCSRANSHRNHGNGKRSWRRRHIGVGYGRCFGSEQLLRGIWEYSTLKRDGARKILADAAQEKQEGKRGQWQQHPPFNEVLKQVKRSADTYCGHQTMRRAYTRMKHGHWESFKEECRKEGKLCEWTFERIREAYEKVAMDDIGRLSIAQEIQRKSADLLRRIIAPVDGRVTLSYVCPHCNWFPLDDYIWWVSNGHGDGNNRKKKHCNWWCAACRGRYAWRAPNRILVAQLECQ